MVAVFAAAALLLPSKVAAQNYVTPTVKPTPPGQLIVVNNGSGDQVDPHVDGDLVCYRDDSSGNSLIRYRNLATGTDNGVPPPLDNRADNLCDVRGTTIVFTRSGATASIFTFETASSTLTEIDPTLALSAWEAGLAIKLLFGRISVQSLQLRR